eukprot:gene960-276_t
MDKDNAAADGSKGGKIKKGRILDPDRCLTDVLELTLPSKKKLMKKNVTREIVVEYASDSETDKRVISNPRRHGDRKKQKSQLENNENMTTSFPEHQLCMEIDSEGSHKDAEHIPENNEKDLKAMISECEKLTLSQKDKPESSKWTDRLEKASAMWEKHRNFIAECALEMCVPLNICENCNRRLGGWLYKPLLPAEAKDAASANIIHIGKALKIGDQFFILRNVLNVKVQSSNVKLLMKIV